MFKYEIHFIADGKIVYFNSPINCETQFDSIYHAYNGFLSSLTNINLSLDDIDKLEIKVFSINALTQKTKCNYCGEVAIMPTQTMCDWYSKNKSGMGWEMRGEDMVCSECKYHGDKNE